MHGKKIINGVKSLKHMNTISCPETNQNSYYQYQYFNPNPIKKQNGFSKRKPTRKSDSRQSVIEKILE